ncbi:MAG: hypothetical protein ABSG77_07505 [Candidatus Acidiferrum sp.]|jgi:uncharacterized membrane protein
MKTEVYSWRLPPSLKADLERVARVRKIRVSAVLDIAVREWLAKNAQEIAGDEEQKRLHAAAEKCIGVIAGKNPRRAETAAATIRKSLRRQYGR